MDQNEVSEQAGETIKLKAARRAGERARIARWDLDVAVFLFVVLIIVIILLFQDVSIEIVAPVAIFGLVAVWLVGWRRGRQLYQVYYDEELAKLTRELVEKEKRPEKTIEETIEEKVQKALRERWR
ncbi:hypothetical protein ES703_76283 [subsurface metagenome]